MIYHLKKQAGFSLVETLVAISLLLIIVTGPMTISIRAAKSSTFATEQVQAFFLAQEGVELVENLRDEYFLAHFNNPSFNAWTNFTSIANCYGGNSCGMDWSPSGEVGIRQCTGQNCKIWRHNDGRSHFNHESSGGEVTPFTRQIFLTHTGGEVYVRSVVTWRTGSLVDSQMVEVDTYLYNIYDTP